MNSILKQLFKLKFFVVLFVLVQPILTTAQNLNTNWKPELNNALQQFLQCQQSADNTQCNKYLGESLNTVYKINDFYSDKLGRNLVASEISKFVKENNKWQLIGPAYDQKALTQAQEFANAKKAVVAVYTNSSGVGHVVLITPGQLLPSGSWGLSVPNTASFFLSQPDKSYIDKGLSFAFGKSLMKDIQLYARNY
jgi:hypothetical protein